MDPSNSQQPPRSSTISSERPIDQTGSPPNPPTALAVRSSPSTTTTSMFRLLDLPAELRLHLYEVLLLDADSYIVPIPHLPPTRAHRSKSLQPVILRLCKQVHDEALPVLYSGNTFMIRTFPLVRCVPELTLYFGMRNAGLIRRVVTIAKAGVEIDEDEIDDTYDDCGIVWWKLKFWGVRVSGEGEEVEEAVRKATERERLAGNTGFLRADEMEIRKMGVRSTWFDYLDEKDSAWVMMRGSKPRA